MTHASDGSGSARDDGGPLAMLASLIGIYDRVHDELDDGKRWEEIDNGLRDVTDYDHWLGYMQQQIIIAARSAVSSVKSATGDRDLDALLAAATARYEAMSPEERAEHDQAQRESWARAMAPCEHGVADWETCPKCRGWS